jgi:hypothetical protein
MKLSVPRRDLREGPASVTLELAGHAPATVQLQERAAVRRVVGSIFSLGLPVMFHGFTRFVPVGPVALAPLPAATAGTGDDLAMRLRRLDDLRAQGLIDDKHRESRAELLRRDVMGP